MSETRQDCKRVTVNRRKVLGGAVAGAGWFLCSALAAVRRPRHLLLRSSWQTVNIGDIAHTPGMLALLERHLPDTQVTLWPNQLSPKVEALLLKRFPRLQVASDTTAQRKALTDCEFALHGLVGWRALESWQKTGKPYGFGGVTLSDAELKDRRDLLAGAQFVFCRDTHSLEALKATGIKGPELGFAPDATFHLDLRDDARAETFLKEHGLGRGEFACFVPRLRWTPYWKEGRTYPPGEIERREAENERFREADHGKLRGAIVAWVRETGKKALLCPEMTYQVELLRPLLFEPLPVDVKPNVVVRPDYWLTDEAASTYARAAAVVSLEMHSPIIALANGCPAIHLREPTDTRKGQMWRDVGLSDWIFEIDDTTGEQIGKRLLEIERNRRRTTEAVRKAQKFVEERGSQTPKRCRVVSGE
jgi:polysaccharide pyruvyl transferase WcaK-like protein